MGTTPLRQFLISLCNNTRWKYSVFWKLKHQTPPILIWEDGYFDSAIEAETSGSKSYDNYVDGAMGISFPNSETKESRIKPQGFDLGGNFLWDPLNNHVPPSIVKLSPSSGVAFIHKKWLVGEVAYTGNHMWVSVNSFFTGDFDSNLVPDWRNEWLLQIALGIKTILLVPVLPDGVIQLGSLEVVAENLAVAGLVRDRFDAYRNMMEETIPFALTSTCSWSSSTPLSIPVENLNASTCPSIKQLKCEELEDSDTINDKMLSTAKLSVSLQTVQDMFLAAEKDAPDIFKTTSEHEIGFPEQSVLPSLSGNSLEMVDNKMFGFSCLEEDLLAYSLSSSQSMEFLGKSLNGITPYSAGEIAAQPVGVDHINNGGYKSMDIYNFPEDCELHKALGPAFQENMYGHMCCSSVLIENACNKNNKSSEICNDLMDITGPSGLAGGCDAEYLLEAVIANLISSSGDPSSSASDSAPSCITSLRQSSAFCQPQEESKEAPKMGNCSDHRSLTTSAFLARGDSSASLDGMASTLTNEEQQVKGHGCAQSGKGKKSNFKTRRAKNGNNQRPRPRDRQLIQDRVKELRELVPNGSKCSIDGLLDQTIKHMLYLRSVTGQAERLKVHLHPEVAGGKNKKSSETNSALRNGTSWAFQIGSECQDCPIVVEDLECPGHMLIEVLCDDHGLFLEIAQLIRRLDLTILKGTLENRSRNTWAHFVVEATKGFHRMEIFWPLLHLLQRKRSCISSRI